MSSRILVALRVPATPARAFQAFTAEIGLWWRPNQLFQFTRRSAAGRLAFEPGEGGRFTETAADGEVFEIGRVTAWQPGARLAFTWRQASFAPGQVTEVEIRFEAVGSETRVTVERALSLKLFMPDLLQADQEILGRTGSIVRQTWDFTSTRIEPLALAVPKKPVRATLDLG